MLTQATLSHLAMPGLRLKMLEDRIFSGLPRLRWLDVRDNFLTTVPFTVIRHQWSVGLIFFNIIYHLFPYLPCPVGVRS